MSKGKRVYLGLGSNLGDREANLKKALALLGERVKIEKVSSLYETEPVGYQEQPKFLNAAVQISTPLAPMQLLALVKGIEGALGREPSFPNTPRPIDIDILLYEGVTLSNPRLTIPHPRMAERAFVLVPLAEIAPEAVHPILGLRTEQLLPRAGGVDGVRLYSGKSKEKEELWQRK